MIPLGFAVIKCVIERGYFLFTDIHSDSAFDRKNAAKWCPVLFNFYIFFLMKGEMTHFLILDAKNGHGRYFARL